MVHVIRTIDAHVGGAAVRLVVDGAPRPSGRTIVQKRDWMARHGDQLRRAALLEPRGHADLVGAMLTEPATPGADAGLLCMDGEGFAALSGAAVIAATTVAVEKGLIVGSSPRLTFDTPAGTVYADPRIQGGGARQRVDSVRVANVPSYVLLGGHTVKTGTRELRVDLAFGGLLYAIVDSEAVGIPVDGPRLPELRRLAQQICESAGRPGLDGARLDGAIFTGPPRDPEAHLRSIAVTAGGVVDRSASVTATSALMAVLDAMGLLGDEGVFVNESLIGTLHHARLTRRTQVGELPAIVTEVDGSAWITGEHTFYMDDDDPFREGFRL
jgi:trans-L-3-hydroxyproline dehydratase